MNQRLIPHKHLAAALLLGLALRLYFILHFPFYSGDTKFYEELARNWIDHGVYGLFIRGQLIPVDMRMPGYPAFLASAHALLGRSRMAVMIVQAVLDLGTCLLTACMAARLAPLRSRATVAALALWLAVLCPFTANYCAAILTETLATFLTALAFAFFIFVFSQPLLDIASRTLGTKNLKLFAGYFLGGGILVGLGTLVRPETPLLLLAVGLVLCLRWRHPKDWLKLALATAWMAVGLLVMLTPWAARNARVLGRVQFLAPQYAETAGDFIPLGFYSWTGTWMTRFGDAYRVTWKLGKEPILPAALPASAVDSDAERARVELLLAGYNRNLQMTPLLDHDFAILARERTARRPLRTYLFIPLARVAAMWLTPRIELLPYSGRLWPPGEKWRANSTDFEVTVGFGVLNLFYVGLAVMGAWRWRAYPIAVLPVMFLIVRTAFLTQLTTVEPRYLIVCFPVLIAIGALAWSAPQAEDVVDHAMDWPSQREKQDLPNTVSSES